MKRFLSLLLPLAASLPLLASAPSDSLTREQILNLLREQPALSGNNHRVYPFDPYQISPAPKGYEAVYISHYGRHGSRYITQSKKYDDVMNLLASAHGKNALTEQGEALYRRYSELYPRLKGHNGDLTDLGEGQHRQLARRMVEAYPSVFGKAPVVDARATIVPRAIISMMSFCDELHVLRPGMQLRYAADHADLVVTALVASEADNERDFNAIFKNGYLGAGLARAEAGIGLDYPAFFLRYFKDMATVEACGKPADLLSALFEIDGTAQCLDFDASLGTLFTEEERFKLWENSNLWGALMFTDNPYSKGLISARCWPLMKDILDKADEDLTTGAVQARLRFGHDTVVGPLMDLLGIDGWQPLGEDMTRWKYHFQSWNIPMASNVQLVFYRNRKNAGDILVRVMYNEKDQLLPLQDQSRAPYYRWSDFKAYYTGVYEEAKDVMDSFWAGNPVLAVEGGKVKGIKEDEVVVYKGVPFATPPVGGLRDKPLLPVQPWKGVLTADHFADGAAQEPVSKDDPVYYREFYEGEQVRFSDDCMYLNIWAPSATVAHPEAKLPVAVWIHGGAMSHGYSFEKEFDGMEWARRGVILVTIPYRLGELGFGTPEQLGFRDQVFALQWVRRNISAFGGDPDNVTVMGQSAGAISVKYLLTFPEAGPLFARAILHSGGGVNRMDNPPILPAGTRGEIIPDAVEKGCFNKKPILMGWVAQDPAFLGEATVKEFAGLITRDNPQVYLYAFNRDLPGEGPDEPNWGAFHSFELWYTFGTLGRSWRPFTEADKALSRRMLDDWTDFAKTGNPGWSPYTPAEPYVETFDVD